VRISALLDGEHLVPDDVAQALYDQLELAIRDRLELLEVAGERGADRVERLLFVGPRRAGLGRGDAGTGEREGCAEQGGEDARGAARGGGEGSGAAGSAGSQSGSRRFEDHLFLVWGAARDRSR
jgi:hypothetical protein